MTRANVYLTRRLFLGDRRFEYIAVMETTQTTTLVDRIRQRAETVLTGSDAFLVEIIVRGHTGTQTIEVYIDGDDGVTIDQCARVSRELGFLLETDNVVQGRYRLNVSSPGADRPLVLPRQYRKHIGRPLRVMYRPDGEDASETLDGKLTAVDASGIEVETKGTVRRLDFERIAEASVVLPW